LRERWELRRAELQRLGALVNGAAIAGEILNDLDQLERAEAEAVLSLEEASRASGYSADHLRHLVADGSIPNAGRKGAPRIRRADLPRRPAHSTSARYDPDADARSLVERR
ncbi:MAG TPA: hypothetical protein VGH98_07210, partial [Gemmatimonadaceae bacterium]